MKKVVCIGVVGIGTTLSAHEHILKLREMGFGVVEYRPKSADIETGGLERSEDSEILNLAIQLNELTERENKAMREAEPFMLTALPKIDMPFMKPLKLSKNEYRHKYGHKK